MASTRRRLDVDGIAVDYAVELDATVAAAAKTAWASMTVPDVTIPASANGGVAPSAPDVDGANDGGPRAAVRPRSAGSFRGGPPGAVKPTKVVPAGEESKAGPPEEDAAGG